MPIFTLMIGTLFFGSLVTLAFGVFRWRHPAGKIAVVGSALVLMLFAVALVLVLVTVGSGSMG